MPGNIRLAHKVEIGVSNFIFGVILAYLFTPRPGTHKFADSAVES